MKKTAVFAVLLFAFNPVFAGTAGDFETKAAETDEKIRSAAREHEKLKAKYKKIGAEIEAMKKNLEGKEKFRRFIGEVKLKYLLGRGNRLAYRMYKNENLLKSLREEYFVYVMIIIDELSKSVKNCIEESCGSLEQIYYSRKEWVDIIRDYNDMYDLELSMSGFVKKNDEDALSDFLSYLERKAIQAEQRIMILEEEKSVRDSVFRRGVEPGPQERERIQKKISELRKIQLQIQRKIKETKELLENNY